MRFTEQLQTTLRAPKMTRTRIILALAVAVTADGLQFFLGPVGWAFPDQVIDMVAFVLTAWAVGFHLLLLPTFIAELSGRGPAAHVDGVRPRRDCAAKTGAKHAATAAASRPSRMILHRDTFC